MYSYYTQKPFSMFGKGLFPQTASEKTQKSQTNNESQERTNALNPNEGNARVTPNEAFWKSRSAIHTSSMEEDHVRSSRD
jgi:hypothetical protein